MLSKPSNPFHTARNGNPFPSMRGERCPAVLLWSPSAQDFVDTHLADTEAAYSDLFCQ